MGRMPSFGFKETDLEARVALDAAGYKAVENINYKYSKKWTVYTKKTPQGTSVAYRGRGTNYLMVLPELPKDQKPEFILGGDLFNAAKRYSPRELFRSGKKGVVGFALALAYNQAVVHESKVLYAAIVGTFCALRDVIHTALEHAQAIWTQTVSDYNIKLGDNAYNYLLAQAKGDKGTVRR